MEVQNKKSVVIVQLKTLLGCGLVAICYFASISCLAPFFSKVAELKGVSISWSGLVFVASPVIVVVISPFLGTVIGRIGARKCFFGGLIVMGISNILFGFMDRFQSPVIFTVGCLVWRGIFGFGAAAMGTNIVFLSAAFPNEINKAVTLNEVAIGIGLSLGPTIGGLLYDWGGFSLPFWILGILTLSTIPICTYCLPEIDNNVEESDKNSGNLWNLIISPVILLNLLATLVFAIGWTFLEPILEPELRKEFGVSSSVTGFIFFVLAVTYMVISIFVGKFSDSIKSVWILTFIGTAGSGVAIFILDTSVWFDIPNVLWMKFGAITLLGIFFGIGFPPTYGIMFKDAVARGFLDNSVTQGTLSGFWYSLFALGNVAGPSFGAIVADHFGFNVTCTIVSITFFVTATLYFMYFISRKTRFAEGYSVIPTKLDDSSSDVEIGRSIIISNKQKYTKVPELTSLLTPPSPIQQ